MPNNTLGQTHRAAVLQHIGRYRMTVTAALASDAELRGLPRKQIKSLLRQMCDEGDLVRATLYRRRPYYYIRRPETAEGSQPTGLPSAAMSETAKIRNYAMLAFCCLDQTQRTRLTTEELQAHFSTIFRVGLPLNYYVDASQEKPRLGFLRIDTGGRGRWDRVLTKCKHDLQMHAIHEGVKPFIDEDAFEITLITTLPQKAKRLAAEISHWNHPCKRLLRVGVLPELLNLIAPPPTRS